MLKEHFFNAILESRSHCNELRCDNFLWCAFAAMAVVTQ
jgi:hypothetical protein